MKNHPAVLLVALIVTAGLVIPGTATAQTIDVEKARAKVQTLSAIATNWSRSNFATKRK